ncbi:hypothetical protein ACVIW2_004504 [Bradyrhizobium huanghuaihaiense]|jgi:hypothetical protein|uniref:Bll1594 protein n=5 Tax=Bradyrhizobium TaxID=374 RepID=Q89U25_BRADU|nr:MULTISPECIES: hypothetical protein [Bradyrhizobium]AJA65737.1 hypothetical protein RN69_39900 [Bradyrhizobium japonicum]AND87235.1 hypothetical protein AAV28_04895 [Bradyrhizobium diazoefficiens USDA 110]APO50219.1 hypothetical protein BD122_08270 [Bradyrhizobium diazoefficiens]KGJ66045.1 hypothetical protein BJA5080_02693 [Bradyrhizobium diazoefficiens SEMIA 5080]KGT76943.1 hypothetical protein MA20_25645 [Bradyrhizobium japonicum]
MTTTIPVERVASVLEAAHFKRVPTPLKIGGIEIDAAAAFVGEPPIPDLIVVGDSLAQTPARLQQVVEGAGRALDMMGSRRPLTLIVVGPRPESSTLSALARHARVLAVGETAGEQDLFNWLAVLLPLTLPKASEDRAIAIRAKLLEGFDDPLALELVEIASAGVLRVASHLADAIDAPFLEDLLSEKEP